MNVSVGEAEVDRRIRRRRNRRRCGGSGVAAASPVSRWKLHGGGSAGGAAAAVSARKLAASLWQFADYGGGVRRRRWVHDRLGFEFCSSLPIPTSAEGVTKWDHYYSKDTIGVSRFLSNMKLLKNQDIATISVASARRAKLFKSEKRVKELEAEQNLSRAKLTQCVKKLDDESQKICSKIKDLKKDIKNEKQNCRKIEYLNSKMLRDIAQAKLSAKKFKQNFEKEKKAREMLEDKCDELAKEIEAKKGQIGELRDQCGRIEEEVGQERKMMKLAEIWREERARMKLVDAKLIWEDKYNEINNLIEDVEGILKSSDSTKNAHQDSHKPETSEISSVSLKQPKNKVSSIPKLERKLPSDEKTCKKISINGSGRLSNGSISSIVTQVCTDEGAVKGRDLRNPHIVRGMKGNIAWPRGIQRQGCKGNLLESKLESQKMLLRNVLKHKG